MESFYRVHPIFEFFLTIYSGFIIAPEFLNRSILERIDIGLQEYKTSLKQELFSIRSKFKLEIEQNKKSDETFWLSEFNKQFRQQIEKQGSENESEIDDQIQIIDKENAEQVIPAIARFIRKDYECMFTFAAMFSFLLLTFNGCDWGFIKENTDKIVSAILTFDICIAIILIVLILRILSSIKISEKAIHDYFRRKFSFFRIVKIAFLFIATLGLLLSYNWVPNNAVVLKPIVIFSSVLLLAYLILRFIRIKNLDKRVHGVLKFFNHGVLFVLLFLCLIISSVYSYIFPSVFAHNVSITLAITFILCAIPILVFIFTLKKSIACFMETIYGKNQIDHASNSLTVFQSDLSDGLQIRKKVFEEQQISTTPPANDKDLVM